MDRQTFERLLYEEESEALDFKREQYAFVKATEAEKSELLKDILGFANAWRRSDAYILIGVEEVRGGRSKILGIPESDQLADHSLQQFVSSLTNRPVRFRYEAFTYDGLHIGVFRIEQQPRPVFLRQDYGTLKKNAVYVRRGSSTSRSMPAGPDEIAQMGEAAYPTVAEISIEFVDPDGNEALGAKVAFETEHCKMPPESSIPKLVAQRQHILGYEIDLGLLDPSNRLNSNYFREYADFEFTRRLLCETRFVIKNVGKTTARSVCVELRHQGNDDSIIVEACDLPDEPSQRSSHILNPALRGIRPGFRREPGDIIFETDNDGVRMVIDCGDLQPGRHVRSDSFFVGKKTSGEIELKGQVFADNLPQPQQVSLNIQVDVKQTTLSVDELVELSSVGDDD